MKALVTGGAGFIGSHITERLLRDGHSVVVLDSFFSGKEENLDFISSLSLSANRYTLIRGDIRDLDVCSKAAAGCDVIFHQAALKSVPQSMNNPYDYNDVNINGTLNLLNAANANKVKRFVFASSSSVYGDVEDFPQRESQYPQLISPYALSKLAGEYYCQIYSKHFGVEAVSLRYFNVFGPRQALDDEYAVVIPKFIHCLLNSQNPPIFGTGKQSRDFTYIDNVVNANLLAAEAKGVAGLVFNIADGVDKTILTLVNELNIIIGTAIEPELLPVRVGDVFKSLADITHAQKLLGYEPLIGFREGLEQTVLFFKEQFQAF
jgi:UDP-N-acetylglucosamine/UDP-N-acetyl-alpha-D-glucosaminouronate 4-epimerase